MVFSKKYTHMFSGQDRRGEGGKVEGVRNFALKDFFQLANLILA